MIEDIPEFGRAGLQMGRQPRHPPSRPLVEELHLASGDELSVVAARRTEMVVEKRDRRAEFLKAMVRFRRPAPEGYTFDRDEANEISVV